MNQNQESSTAGHQESNHQKQPNTNTKAEDTKERLNWMDSRMERMATSLETLIECIPNPAGKPISSESERHGSCGARNSARFSAGPPTFPVS
ncbi:uncharacterized protein PGTG_21933 [Puccinia graminis f. sp. tritici CRL 75-36-700-3]|uniref:Uncharacterized protein n=1 Tax=Puccinia graminis f. sp. tritici (strain CRL 75-36-700-3 / race SCCL) TaxID=418459 RepID=H6QT37_PUCGT|nr:uncharacterized protein PGTG_21933 [Puccinia graminis f. sp. tritici CRL 75-36-700-3]EHS64003.1 hypothetical protein PGTG_21933 [Puccinia graminis f. sp. tritici CRL 75-36-700-3]